MDQFIHSEGEGVDYRENLLQALDASLGKQSAMPNLGRWLNALQNEELMGVAVMALEGKHQNQVWHVARALAAAEGIHRPSATRKEKCIQNLGWSALAEYAYRRDWAIIGNNPSLLRDPRETSSITWTGELMISALGQHSKIASLMKGWLKIDQSM